MSPGVPVRMLCSTGSNNVGRIGIGGNDVGRTGIGCTDAGRTSNERIFELVSDGTYSAMKGPMKNGERCCFQVCSSRSIAVAFFNGATDYGIFCAAEHFAW